MSKSPSAVHDTFVIERTLKAPPARVFRAFADPAEKAKWFGGGPEWKALIREQDFRVGGAERDKGQWIESGDTSDFQCLYQDIAPDRRIVYSYKMYVNDALISVSLATIEFEPAGAGTRLRVIEQGVFLDGYEDGGGRERGVGELMDRLAASLAD